MALKGFGRGVFTRGFGAFKGFGAGHCFPLVALASERAEWKTEI
jgi:hypothetical protein